MTAFDYPGKMGACVARREVLSRLLGLVAGSVLLLLLSFAADRFGEFSPETFQLQAQTGVSDRLTECPDDSPSPEQNLLARNSSSALPALLPVERRGRSSLVTSAGGSALHQEEISHTPCRADGSPWRGRPFLTRRSSAPLFLLYRNLRA